MFKYYAPPEVPAEDPQTLALSGNNEELGQDLTADTPTTLPSKSVSPPLSGAKWAPRSSRIRWDAPAATELDEISNSSVAKQIRGSDIGSPEPTNFKRPLLAGLITSAVVFSLVGAGAGLVARHDGPESNTLARAAIPAPGEQRERSILKKDSARLLADDQDEPLRTTFSANVAAFSGLLPQTQTEAPSFSGQFQSTDTRTPSASISSYASAQRFQADRAGGLSAISAAMGQNHQPISDIARQQSTGADLEATDLLPAPLVEGEGNASTTASVTADVNLREKASRKGKIIAVLPADTSIQLGDCGKWWCEASSDGKHGFVSKRFVQSNG